MSSGKSRFTPAKLIGFSFLAFFATSLFLRPGICGGAGLLGRDNFFSVAAGFTLLIGGSFGIIAGTLWLILRGLVRTVRRRHTLDLPEQKP